VTTRFPADVEVDGMPDDGGALPEGPDAVQPPVEPQSPAVDEPATDAPDEVTARLAEVEAALVALARRHDSESERAAARERVIERQHADIERLRTDDRFGLLRPVVVELGRLRNDLLRQAGSLRPDYSVDEMVKLLRSFADSVEDTLLECGVGVLPHEVGAPFAPRHQQVARIVEVDDPERDGTVAEVVQDGYTEVDGGRVVVPARVTVHRVPAGDTNATKEHVDA
jgi:molecular chaperone GrpE (heat shock protein)